MTSQSDEEKRLQRARELHSKHVLIDGHNDLPWALRSKYQNRLSKVDLLSDKRGDALHTDFPKIDEGGLGGQFWSVYVKTASPSPVKDTLEQIDVVYRLLAQYPDRLQLALTVADIQQAFANRKLASLLGMEGGHSIENSLGVLRMMFQLGVRYMTLTHNGHNDWADAAVSQKGVESQPLHKGLSSFGVTVVQEMNRLGMCVDLSHVSPDTMVAAIKASRAPVIFSHSSCRAKCNHPRNVPDHVLKQLPEKDGIVMITFVGVFVSETHPRANDGPPSVADLKKDNDDDVKEPPAKRARVAQPATIGLVADHIDHVRNTIGVDFIGLGGDYDGTTSLTVGLEHVGTYPRLTAELLRRGYTEEDIGKILGGNLLRVLGKVEACAKALANEPPSEVLITDDASYKPQQHNGDKQ